MYAVSLPSFSIYFSCFLCARVALDGDVGGWDVLYRTK